MSAAVKLDANAVAIARIRRALAHLQEAQNHVGRALQELSPITGGALPVYSKGHRLYDQVHAYWYKVQALTLEPRAGKLGLDHEPTEDRPE
jgi:hypothetical protein